VRSLLNPEEYDERTDCDVCGAHGLEPDQPCDCFEEEEDLSTVGFVPLTEVVALTREGFYDAITEDDQYSGLVDPDDFEIILVATVIALDKKLQEALRQLGTKN
jgi:hypothetical protein